MNDDLYGLQASGIDPAIAAKMIPLQRQQAIAEALLKQSMQPINVPQGTKIHPLQGVAQMVQAYMARRGLEGADAERGKLSAENAEMAKTAMGDYERVKGGFSTPPIVQNDDEGNQMPMVQTKGDPRAAVAMAMSNPLLAKNALVSADIANMRKAAEPYSLREGEKRFAEGQVVAENKKTTAPLVKEIGLDGNKVQTMVSKDGGATWVPQGAPTDKFNPRAGVTVNNQMPAAEKAAAVEMAKLDAKTTNELREAGIAAGSTLNVLDRMEKSVTSDKVANGLTADVVSGLQNIAVTLGDKSLASKAAANEQYIADVAELVRGKIKALGSGTAISNTDLLFTQRSMPELLKTREGKLEIIRAMRSDLQYLSKRGRDAEAHFRKNKGSLEGFDAAPKSGWAIVD